jgi:hypothetical protein
MAAILPCHFHDQGLENQRNHDVDDQGGYDVPPINCDKLGCDNTSMGPLVFPMRCEYSWNGSHSHVPHFRNEKTIWVLKKKERKNQRNLELDDQGGYTCTTFPPSGYSKDSKERAVVDC